MSNELRPAAVRVPCSTSNLGSGYDTLGLALTRYLRADLAPGPGTLSIEREGTLAGLDVPPAGDLLVAALTHGLAEAGFEAGGHLRVRSEIPLERGLGSSAAALVAGFELARAVLGRAPDRPEAFRFACDHEGHGDNAAPCAMGGLVGVVRGPSGPRALALELSREVGFAYAAPSRGVSTAAARRALPKSLPHPKAVAGLGRITALVKGLAEADEELIRIGVEDELHVPYRLKLIEGAPAAIEAGYEAGAWAVTISGSGSGLLAICATDRSGAVASAMKAAFAEHDADALGFALRPDWHGATHEAPEGT